jgi:hypothetical protein
MLPAEKLNSIMTELEEILKILAKARSNSSH